MQEQLSYSIWLVPPEGEIRVELMSTIRSLAARWGGPVFLPHVSLVGGVTGDQLEYRAKFSKVARQIGPIRVSLTGCQQSSHFFRSLYLKVAETSELIFARDIGSKIFGSLDEPFVPHLSLFYGVKEQSEKAAAINEGKFPLCSFDVDELFLVQNDEHSLKWHVIEQSPIGNTDLKARIV
ncbi:2'-5' RNA ligase family protein [Gammaproteobacteria bacterium]|nr:2'-5' RNA ligase family protein [Gammaproteobacteria bacterium]